MAGPIDGRLVRRGRATRIFLVALAVVGLVQAVAIVAQARLLADAISSVFASHRPDGLTGWIAGLAAVFTLRALLGWAAESLAHHASARVKAGLRTDLARARLARPADASVSSSTLVTLTTQGLDALDGYYSKYLPQLVLAVIVPLVVGVVILSQDVASAVIIALTLPLIPVFMALIGWTTQKQVERRWRVQTRLANHFADLVSGLATLQAFGRARGQREGLRVTEQRNRAETMKTLRVSFLSSFALELLATLSVAVVAVTVGFRVVFATMDLRTALFVLILAPEAYLPLRQVGTHYHDATDGMAAADQALQIIQAANLPGGPAAGGASGGPVAEIRLEHISLTWPGAPSPVLDDVTLDLAPGEVVALQGPSGGGKSTLLAVLMGFRTPDSGRVLCGGEDVLTNPDEWRRRLAWVGQEPGMPEPTIAGNIAIGARREVGRVELRELLDLAGGPELELDRPVGDDAEGLSAGEQRRVAIARALLRLRDGASLLVMDEPTAGLDADAEAAVIAAVRASGAGALVVSHRPAVLAMADRVVTVGGAR
ncbi:thiol reductant ABC exporter subunit CydD [Luteococcus sp. H138]|uniref:thiol reductant ABC exporter subunit CydD n=1 Tax=unclassified Luteococcus TaxID=2639923 RepID=UPI00313C502D